MTEYAVVKLVWDGDGSDDFGFGYYHHEVARYASSLAARIKAQDCARADLHGIYQVEEVK